MPNPRKKYKLFYSSKPIFSKPYSIGILLFLLACLVIPFCLLIFREVTGLKKTTIPTTTTITITTPVTNVTVGEKIPVTLSIIPGSNPITIIKLVLTYDKSVLNLAIPFVVNKNAFPVILENPDYTVCNNTICSVSVIISTGTGGQRFVMNKTPIGSLTFIAVGATEHTQVQLDPVSQLMSEDTATTLPLTVNPLTLTIQKITPQQLFINSQCYYQIVCLTCPTAHSCDNFSCSKLLICPQPTRPSTPTPTMKKITPTLTTPPSPSITKH